MTKKPLKVMIAEAFRHGERLDAKSVHGLLEGAYPGERYCSVATVTDHLKSLKAVGILQEDGSYVNGAGQLVSVYRITEYGSNKIK